MTARAQDVSALFVAEKRRLNASWSAIARMAGVAETTLRQLHDPDWRRGLAGPMRRDARSEREKVRDALVERGLNFDQAVILSRLWLADGARRKSAELASGISGGEAAGIAVRDALRVGRRVGLVASSAGTPGGTTGYALTLASIVALSKMAGLGQGRPGANGGGA